MQNTSSAVMQQRVEPHDSLDDFPTPPWATRALTEHLTISRDLSDHDCWEPACNRGHMAKPLAESFFGVLASDIHDYGFGLVDDFLAPTIPAGSFDWVITNPPFKLAEQFALKAFQVATAGVALFVRLAFLESEGRCERLFTPHPPTFILQFSERVVLHKGIVRDPNEKYWDEDAGKWKKPSTATAYCWIVWTAPYDTWRPTTFGWISPCRKRLEKAEDYALPGAVA